MWNLVVIDMIGATIQEMNYLMEPITDAVYRLPIFLETEIMGKSHDFLKDREYSCFYLLYI